MTPDHSLTNLDCTDIKALLSGLVDDQVDAHTRHQAERHLTGCAPCRAMLDQAERLNALIACDADHVAGDALRPDFLDSVLDRTVNAARGSLLGRRWVNWTGWAAAAACLGLAMFIYISDRRDATDSGAMLLDGNLNIPVNPGAGAAFYRTGKQSWIVDDLLTQPEESAGDTGTSLGALSDGGRMTSDEAQALYAAAVVLGMLKSAPTVDEARLQDVRNIIQYDDLIARLRGIDRLPTRSARAAVSSVQQILVQLADPAFSTADLPDLLGTVRSTGLEDSLRKLSRRAEEMNSL